MLNLKPGVIKRLVNPDQGIIFPLFFIAIVSNILKLVVPKAIIRFLLTIALFINSEVFKSKEPHSSCIL